MHLPKRLTVAALAVASALSLTGCMRVTQDVHIDANGTITVATEQIAINKSLIRNMAAMGGADGGQAAPTDLDDFRALAEQQGPNQDCTYSETDTEFVATCGIGDGDFASLTAADSGVTITANGEVISVAVDTGVLSRQALGSASDPVPGELSVSGMQATLNLHFPGEVLTVTGPGASVSPDDSTVAAIDLMQAVGGEPVTVTASAQPSSIPLIPVALAVVFGLAVLAAAVVIVRRRRDGGDAGDVIPFGQPHPYGVDSYTPGPLGGPGGPRR